MFDISQNVLISYAHILYLMDNMLSRNSFTSLWRLKLLHWSHRMSPPHPLLREQTHPQRVFLQACINISEQFYLVVSRHFSDLHTIVALSFIGLSDAQISLDLTVLSKM